MVSRFMILLKLILTLSLFKLISWLVFSPTETRIGGMLLADERLIFCRPNKSNKWFDRQGSHSSKDTQTKPSRKRSYLYASSNLENVYWIWSSEQQKLQQGKRKGKERTRQVIDRLTECLI